MALSVRFHPAARDDLFALYDHIAADAGRQRAAAYVERLEEACRQLGTFPALGRAADDLGVGLRVHPVERRAVIVYRVGAEAVDILAVYYGGRDLAALIPRDP
jgi:toxin ParE1/3/4